MMNENQKDINPINILDTVEKAEISLDDVTINRHKRKETNILKELLSYIILIVIALLLATVIHQYLFLPVNVVGDSMNTTIYNGDQIFVSRVSKIKRFDVIVFNVKKGEPAVFKDDRYIKRVIGLPGDDVEMIDYQLYINGELIQEPFLNPELTDVNNSSEIVSFSLQSICSIKNISCNIDGKVQIPEGYYLVLGDNRNNSSDSRYLGLIPKDRIVGKAEFVFFPFSRFGKTFE